MTIQGGSWESVSLNGREFKCTGDTDPTLVLGGVEVEIQMNGLGGYRELKTPIPWAVNGAQVELDIDNGDLEFLVDFQDSGGGDVCITLFGGTSYTRPGNITGTIEANPKTASISLNLAGGGKLKQL
jgi:hypothetical protein